MFNIKNITEISQNIKKNRNRNINKVKNLATRLHIINLYRARKNKALLDRISDTDSVFDTESVFDDNSVFDDISCISEEPYNEEPNKISIPHTIHEIIPEPIHVTIPEPIIPEPIIAEPTIPVPTIPVPIIAEPTIPVPIIPEPTIPEPTIPEPIKEPTPRDLFIQFLLLLKNRNNKKSS